MTLSHAAVPHAVVVFDIDGVIRDVGGSYRRALADTVEHFTSGAYRPSQTDIDALKAEGLWNNDWEASRELIYRYFEAQGQTRSQIALNYDEIVLFFQRRYRGPNPDDPDHWTGYISQEPLLLKPSYLEQLTEANIPWGFFSGATRGSASYVLERRLGLRSPILIAMEDAPGKPDPTGLFKTVETLEAMYSIHPDIPVIYAGDTVADLQTVEQAQLIRSSRKWIGVGILPPHVHLSENYATTYTETLMDAGASLVLKSINELNPEKIYELIGA